MAPLALLESVSELEAALQLAPKERPSIAGAVDTICQHAQESGLAASLILRIVKAIIRPPFLDNSTSKLLIEHLCPNETIDEQVVYTIAAVLGPTARKPSPVVQASLLKWLIIIRPVLQNHRSLARVYAVLFNLIDFLAIRPDLCHLLAISTEEQHVKPFRVEVLLKMQSIAGQDPTLTGLLKIYRSFRPELIPDGAVAGRASVFDDPDHGWKPRLDAILDGRHVAPGLGDEAQFRVLGKSIYRSKATYIPQVYTTDVEAGLERFEDVNGTEQFADVFHKLQKPARMAAALNDPLLQHYLELVPDNDQGIDQESVDDEVGKALDAQKELFELGEGLDRSCLDILRASLAWAQRFRSLLPTVKSFCVATLQTPHWHAHVELFANLLSWSAPSDELDWRVAILDAAIEQSILGGPDGQRVLLSIYTQVVYNRMPGLRNGNKEVKYFRSIEPFVNHVSLLGLTILASTSSTSAYLTVANWVQAVADIATNTQSEMQNYAVLPFDRHTVYLLLFSSPNLALLSRLGEAFADQKETAFTIAKRKDGSGGGRLKPGITAAVNAFSMDISNLLWRSRAFSSDKEQDKTAAACMMHPTTIQALQEYTAAIPNIKPPYSLLNLFTLSFHPALSNVSAAAWHDLEADMLAQIEMDVDDDGSGGKPDKVTHRGPVTRRSLQLLAHEGGAAVEWQVYRLHVLQWLHDRGAPGIQKLMQRLISSLMPNAARVPLDGSQTDSPMQI